MASKNFFNEIRKPLDFEGIKFEGINKCPNKYKC